MIASLKENVSELFSNKRFLIILLIAGIFIAAAVYTYRKVLKPRMDNALIPNSEYLQDSNGTGSQSSESADVKKQDQ